MISHEPNAIKVHPMDVRGHLFEVWVAPSGYFMAEYNDQQWSGDTRDQLQSKLMKATAQDATRISIPFEHRDSNGNLTKGVVTGRHAGNRNMLITWAGGNKTQETSVYRSMRPLSTEDRDRWERLYQQAMQSREALNNFETEHKIDLREAADQAIKEAMA